MKDQLHFHFILILNVLQNHLLFTAALTMLHNLNQNMLWLLYKFIKTVYSRWLLSSLKNPKRVEGWHIVLHLNRIRHQCTTGHASNMYFGGALFQSDPEHSLFCQLLSGFPLYLKLSYNHLFPIYYTLITPQLDVIQ